MPRAMRRCPGDHGNCTALIRGSGYCDVHTPKPWSGPRTASSRVTMTHAWRKMRPEILKRDGRQCQIRGPHCTGVATQVDKIKPAATHPELALDPENARAACPECNAWKSRTADRR